MCARAAASRFPLVYPGPLPAFLLDLTVCHARPHRISIRPTATRILAFIFLFAFSIEHQIKSNSPRSNEQTNTPHQTTPTPHAPTGARICRIPVQPYAPHRINPVAQSALASFVTSSPPGTSLSRCNLSLHEPTRDLCPSTVLFAPISSQYISSQFLPPFSSLASFVLPRYPLLPRPTPDWKRCVKGIPDSPVFVFSLPRLPPRRKCVLVLVLGYPLPTYPASLCSSLALASFCFRNRNNSRTASNIHLSLCVIAVPPTTL